jgi:thiosulfate/3-mercaptopyruvate sulfurtransferase
MVFPESPVRTAHEVNQLMEAQGARVVLLDVRWSLTDGSDRRSYVEGHIPGARFVDLETDLAGPPGRGGRHPLPAESDFEAAMRRVGIDDESLVVCYDGAQSTSAARAWWLLQYFGHRNALVLDGGLAAWTAAGLATESGEAPCVPGDFEARAKSMPTIEVDSVLGFAENNLLLDARARERYLGEVEPVDPVAGHIPGAVNAPTLQNVEDDGRFKDLNSLRERFMALGAGSQNEIGVYCGSGVTATHEILALRIAGYPAALFPGSWSHWVEDRARPVAKGVPQS